VTQYELRRVVADFVQRQRPSHFVTVTLVHHVTERSGLLAVDRMMKGRFGIARARVDGSRVMRSTAAARGGGPGNGRADEGGAAITERRTGSSPATSAA
jgi:hypothetical protein